MLLFSRQVVSDSSRPIGLQHARLPCPSPSPRLPKVISIESVMPSNHPILCLPLLLLPSPSVPLHMTNIRPITSPMQGSWGLHDHIAQSPSWDIFSPYVEMLELDNRPPLQETLLKCGVFMWVPSPLSSHSMVSAETRRQFPEQSHLEC